MPFALPKFFQAAAKINGSDALAVADDGAIDLKHVGPKVYAIVSRRSRKQRKK